MARMKIKTKRIVKYTILILVLAPILFYTAVFFLTGSIENESWNGQVTNDNLCSYLSGLNTIKGMPSSGVIYFESYKYEGSGTTPVATCIITKGSATQGIPQEYDVKVAIKEDFISGFGDDFCTAIKSADNQGEVTFKMEKRLFNLLFQYKKVLGYARCVGI